MNKILLSEGCSILVVCICETKSFTIQTSIYEIKRATRAQVKEMTCSTDNEENHKMMWYGC